MKSSDECIAEVLAYCRYPKQKDTEFLRGVEAACKVVEGILAPCWTFGGVTFAPDGKKRRIKKGEWSIREARDCPLYWTTDSTGYYTPIKVVS